MEKSVTELINRIN